MENNGLIKSPIPTRIALPVMQMDRFYFGLVRFSNIQILNRFGALIGLIWIGFGALARTGSPVKLDKGSIEP
jgi:hypothetical protein